MISVDVATLTRPYGVLRVLSAVLTCVTFGLVASAGHSESSYWAWCMFTWFFCFFLTLLILVLEFTTLSDKVPFSWDDFSSAFPALATLMSLTASIIYPTLFSCGSCQLEIAASVLSWFSVATYAGETVLSRLRPRGANSGFLSTILGLLKMLETFLACLIFTSLDANIYSDCPELQWCVAVYALCFTFNLLIVVVSAAQLTSFFPLAIDKVVTVYNVVAAAMYMTAMVVWPLYSLWDRPRPADCGRHCYWDKLVVVTIMTIANVIVYSVDAVLSIHMVLTTKDQ